MKGEGKRQIRCAVYTRKSTEEGLEQEFNSLDAQYEACTAYVSSQRHEGWTLLKERYDDGGFSGGTLERPGLKRLLADVEARKIDVIVVYKVDRLTRALSDFARIVDVLDSREASFVSVTQSFNTTTSMGRLTLNVLLSFAQFEREVIAERVRDKVAASRRKGIWMGGSPPLGYEVRDRKLVVNEADARTVRHIFRRYVELGCGRELLEELRRDEIKTRARADRGGVYFGRGALFYLLTNRSYVGEARHRDRWYPGEHARIVDEQLWHAAQETLERNRASKVRSKARTKKSMLAGLLFDKLGRRMAPSHTKRRGRAYRYYATAADEVTDVAPAARVPAWDLERAVLARIEGFLGSKTELLNQLSLADADELRRVAVSADALAKKLADGPVYELISKVELSASGLKVSLKGQALATRLAIDPGDYCAPITLRAGAVRIRHGKEVKLLLHGGNDATLRHPNLTALLREAAEAKQLIDSSPGESLSAVAARAGRCRTYLGKLYRIAHLAPQIVDVIMAGQQPVHLTTRLLLSAQLPAKWAGQRMLLRLD